MSFSLRYRCIFLPDNAFYLHYSSHEFVSSLLRQTRQGRQRRPINSSRLTQSTDKFSLVEPKSPFLGKGFKGFGFDGLALHIFLVDTPRTKTPESAFCLRCRCIFLPDNAFYLHQRSHEFVSSLLRRPTNRQSVFFLFTKKLNCGKFVVWKNFRW